MAERTYGDRPISFQVEENGEYYCLGLHVAKYLGAGNYLYKKYPGLFQRRINNDERKKLFELGLDKQVYTTTVSLLRASEVEDLIKGNGDKYKTAQIHSTKPLLQSECTDERPMPSATKSSRLDGILPAKRIYRKRLHDKVRSSSRCLDNRNPLGNTKTAKRRKIFMPLRSNEEIEARRIREISMWNRNNGAAKRVSRENVIAIEMEEEQTEIAVNSSQLEATRNQKCRLCLKNCNQFLELFQNDDVLPLKIMTFASVKIKRGDGLPSAICASCRQLLDISYNFKCLVEKSDTALRESETALRALLMYSSLFTGIRTNQNAVKESLARSVSNDFAMQYKPQRLPLQSINHLVSNDYNNRQDSVACEINEECISSDYHSHKKGRKDKNKDNESDNEKQAEKDENVNESKIPISVLIQSTKSESAPIERQELLVPEVIDLSEGEDNHHQADGIISHSDVHEFRLEKNSTSGREYKAIDVPSESNKLETAKCKISIGRITDTDTDNDRPLNSESSEETYSDCIQSSPTIPKLSSRNTIHQNDLRYTCYWCEEQFSDIAKLMNHMTNNHESLNNENKVDIDNNCGRVKTDRKVDKLDKDIGGSVDKQKVNRRNSKLKCNVCAKKFTYPKSFLSHIRTHPGYKGSGTSDDHSEKANTKKAWKRENNWSNSKMNKSDNDNSPLKGLQCIRCDRVLSSKRSLRRHILTHKDVRFNCSICEKEFSHLDELKDHQQSEHRREILGTSDDTDYDTVDERRKETECRPHERAMCPEVPTLNHSLTTCNDKNA